MWPLALGALGLGALGYWILARTSSKVPVTTQTTSATGAQQVTSTVGDVTKTAWWAYWNGLSAAQQQAYRQAIWNWMQSGQWPATVQDPTSSGITSLASLNDAGNLSFATDAYQQAAGIGPANDPNVQAGIIDAFTYQSALTNWSSAK